MADLPHQDYLTVPIQWSGETQKAEVQGAGYKQTTTFGWRAWSETATLEWKLLTSDEANGMLEQFRNENFNSVYAYNCNVRGPIRLQLDGTYAFTEEYDTKTVTVQVAVRRV